MGLYFLGPVGLTSVRTFHVHQDASLCVRAIFLSKYKVTDLIPPSENHGAAEHCVLSSYGTDSALLTTEASSAGLVCTNQSLNSCLHALLGASTSKKDRGGCGKAGNFTT